MDGATVRSQLDTRQVGLLEFIMKANGELIDGHHEKVRREETPLTNSPMGRKLSCGLTIHKDGESRGGNAGMDQADEGSREIHYVKRSNDEVLADAIEGLGKIKF